MKFWELISAFRECEQALQGALNSPAWSQPFGVWYEARHDLIQSQDRAKLDFVVPDSLVAQVAALAGDRLVFYVEDGWLRRQPISSTSQRLSPLDVVTRFGGAIIEEVQEYGAARVQA